MHVMADSPGGKKTRGSLPLLDCKLTISIPPKARLGLQIAFLWDSAVKWDLQYFCVSECWVGILKKKKKDYITLDSRKSKISMKSAHKEIFLGKGFKRCMCVCLCVCVCVYIGSGGDFKRRSTSCLTLLIIIIIIIIIILTIRISLRSLGCSPCPRPSLP
jgi:hypothetical protein